MHIAGGINYPLFLHIYLSVASVAGLFGAAVVPEIGEGKIDQPAKKRIILKDNESVAAVLFCPWEVAGRL